MKKTYSQLTKQQKDSFKFQFARDVTSKLSRKEVIGIFCLVAMQANNDLYRVQKIAEKYCYTQVCTSKLLIEGINQLGIDWKVKLKELCSNFGCEMNDKECVEFLVGFVDDACADDVTTI